MNLIAFMLWLGLLFHKTYARFIAEAVHAYKTRLNELENPND